MPDPGDTETPAQSQEEENPAEEGEYIPSFFTADSLPNTTGKVASAFSKQSLEQQQDAATNLYSFLWTSDGNDLLRLNIGTTLLTALVAIPASNLIKVVYGFGVGTAGIGEQNPLQDQLLMLHGEGDEDIGPPDILVIAKDGREQVEVLTPSDETVQQLLTDKGTTFGRYLVAPRNVNDREIIMKVAPIPTYMVYNGFAKDLHAADIYKQLLKSEFQNDMIDHAKKFLRAQLVGPLRNKDNKPYVSQQDWNQMPPVEAKV